MTTIETVEQEMARELEVSTDMNKAAHLLTSQGWHDKAQADELSSALVGYEIKYGRDVLRDLEDMISEAIYYVCDRIHGGDYEDV